MGIMTALIILFSLTYLNAQESERQVFAYWSINENYPGYNNQWTFPITSSIGSGQMTTTFSSVTGITGTGVNLVSGYASEYAIRVNVIAGESGRFLTLSCSKQDYKSIIVSFAINRTTNSGYVGATVSYSTDGSSFEGGIYKSVSSTSFETKVFSFENNTSIDSQDLVYFRIALSGTNTYGSNTIDNIQITGIPNPETLPCELHSFAAIPGYQNSVNLTWITHSETGLQGFRLYRNNTDCLDSACLISPLISASNSSTTQTYSYTDNELTESDIYYYWLQVIEGNGLFSYTQPIILNWNQDGQPDPPPSYDDRAFRAYPNPFNAETTIHYELSKASCITLEVYNSRGQKVRCLDQSSRPAGSYNAIWDGRDDNQRLCASGVYRIVMVRDGFRSAKKVVLLQ